MPEEEIKETEAETEEEDWLSGICDYDGPEDDLPAGGHAKIPGWEPEKVAKVWVVMDAESEEGIREKKTAELTADDIIIGVRLNPKTLSYIYKQYGPRFYLLRDANGEAWMTPDQWQAKFKTNGLGLVAMRNMRRKLSGGGIRTGF